MKKKTLKNKLLIVHSIFLGHCGGIKDPKLCWGSIYKHYYMNNVQHISSIYQRQNDVMGSLESLKSRLFCNVRVLPSNLDISKVSSIELGMFEECCGEKLAGK